MIFLGKNCLMQKISFIFQTIFKILLIFLLIFVWVRYFIRPLWLSLLITAILTAVIDLISRIFTKKRSSALALKASEREEAENIFLSLALESNALDFFLKLASSKHKAEKKDGVILIEHEEKSKAIIYPFMQLNNLSCNEIKFALEKLNDLGAQKAIIICFDAGKECYDFAKNFDQQIEILDRYSAYQKLYKPYDCKPEITHKYKKGKRLRFREIIEFSFNRSRAKGYFFSAFILILSSFFVRTAIYYVVIASVLIIFALISLYNPFERKKLPSSIL